MKAKNAAFDLIADIGTAMVFLNDKSKEGMLYILSISPYIGVEKFMKIKVT